MKEPPKTIHLETQIAVIDILPDDHDEAMWVLASIVESCLHSGDMSIETFIDRVINYRDHRP